MDSVTYTSMQEYLKSTGSVMKQVEDEKLRQRETLEKELETLINRSHSPQDDDPKRLLELIESLGYTEKWLQWRVENHLVDVKYKTEIEKQNTEIYSLQKEVDERTLFAESFGDRHCLFILKEVGIAAYVLYSNNVGLQENYLRATGWKYLSRGWTSPQGQISLRPVIDQVEEVCARHAWCMRHWLENKSEIGIVKEPLITEPTRKFCGVWGQKHLDYQVDECVWSQYELDTKYNEKRIEVLKRRLLEVREIEASERLYLSLAEVGYSCYGQDEEAKEWYLNGLGWQYHSGELYECQGRKRLYPSLIQERFRVAVGAWLRAQIEIEVAGRAKAEVNKALKK